jgi:hypothetical protein
VLPGLWLDVALAAEKRLVESARQEMKVSCSDTVIGRRKAGMY